MNNSGPLSFDAVINNTNFIRQIDEMERRIIGMSNKAIKEGDRIDQNFRRLGQLAAGYFAFSSLDQLPSQLIKVRGEFQQLEIAFSTMLRSKDKADQLLNQAAEFAAKTPYGLSDTGAGIKQLLAYGETADNAISTLRKLGDIAAGISAPLNDIVYLYGTTMTQGRLYTQDLNQFTGRGIPMIRELANVFGVAESKVKVLVEQGKVGFPEVQQVIENLTREGSMFGGMMEAQSKSLTGLTAQLSDAWDMMLNDIGKSNEGLLSSIITTATDAVQHYQQIIDVLKVVAVTYGSYKAAAVLVTVAEQTRLKVLQWVKLEMHLAAAAGEVLTEQQARQIVVTKMLQQAQMGLNASLLANPVVAVVMAITTLVTAYYAFREETVKLRNASELLSEANTEVSKQFKVQESEVKSLISVLQNQNIAESQRLIAYNKLKNIAPEITKGLDFQAAKTANLTKELDIYLVSLEKKIRLEAQTGKLKTAIEQSVDAEEDYKRKREEYLRLKVNYKPASRSRMVLTGPDAGASLDNQGIRLQVAFNAMEEAAKRLTDSQKAVKEVENSYKTIFSKDSIEGMEAEVKRLEMSLSRLDKTSLAYKKTEEDLINAKKKRDSLSGKPSVGDTFDESLAKAETADSLRALKVVADTDAKLETLLNKVKDKAKNAKKGSPEKAKLENLSLELKRITTNSTSDSPAPFGSLDYWEAVAKKAEEVIGKTPADQIAKIRQQQAIQLNAEQKAERIRKETTVRSFQEEIEEKKNQYELYERWVSYVSKDAADRQFASLLKSGQSYVDYLTTEITKLEGKKTLTEAEQKNLGGLKMELAITTGQDSPLEAFQNRLQALRHDAGSTIDFLTGLRKMQQEVDVNDNSQAAIAKRKQLAELIIQTEKDLRAELAQFLVNATGSEEQRTAITKKYVELRMALEKKYGTDRGKAYQDSLAVINRAEEEEFRDMNERIVQSTEAFKKLNDAVYDSGRKGKVKRLEDVRKALAAITDEAGKATRSYRELKKEEVDLSRELGPDKKREDFLVFSELAGALGNELSAMNGELGETGKLLSGIAGQANLVMQAFKEGATPSQLAAVGIQGLINLLNVLISSANQRKQAELAYYRAVNAQQQQYNVLLNDQIGLQAEANESVFVKDFEGRLRAGSDKLTDAQKKYQEALAKLQEGRAKSGQSNAVDWDKVGKAAGSGAAVGAAIGTAILPVVGTIAGAVMGTIYGGVFGVLFGKKKQDDFVSLLEKYPDLIKEGADGWEELDENLAQTLISQDMVDENTKQLLQNTLDWAKQIAEAKEQIKGVISELAGSLGDTLRDSLVTAFKEGTDAAQAFGDSVSKILEDMISQLIFNQVFSKSFQQLQDEMMASYAGGDNNWLDDFGRFFGQANELWTQFYAGLEAAQQAAGAYGLSVFKKNTGAATDSKTALSGAIKGVSEETASVLAGQMNAIRINQAESLSVVRQSLIQLTEIASNSRYLRRLEGIEQELKTINTKDSLRAKGILG